MENSEKVQDTASTTFFEGKKSVETSECQPIKPTFPELIEKIQNLNDRSGLIEMEDKLNNIRKKLRSNDEKTEKLFDLDELKSLIQKSHLELSQSREKCLEQQGEVRQQIQTMLNNLEKQLQQYRKEWERLRNKCESELSEHVEEIKIAKATNESLLNGMLKDSSAVAKESINSFSQELKLSRKNRNLKVSRLLGQLEAVKGNLNRVMQSEENKRKEYDEIIYGLLEKTCENAESAIRRRVY